MYGITPSTDLSFLKGKTLCQVAFGPHDLQLGFCEGARISIWSTVGYGVSDGAYILRIIGEPKQDEPARTTVLEEPAFLLSLLMKEVADVSWTAKGTLTVTFPDDLRLQIYDDSEQFESYSVEGNGQLIHV